MADRKPDIEMIWTFEAPRNEVWREWTEPERFADWYGGEDYAISTDEIAMDVHRGPGARNRAAICPLPPTAVPSKAGPASSPGLPSASRAMNLARANRLRDDFQIEQEEIE
jgi:Activator of Hsp90 ATPase homolog 1-like protein